MVVVEARPTPPAVGKLEKIWVRLFGVPPSLLSEAKLMAAMVLIGQPLSVDELSIHKEESILMQLLTPAPARLRTTVHIAVNGEIFAIKIVPDLGKHPSSSFPPPFLPPNDKDDQDPKDGKDTEEQTANEEHWKRKKGRSTEKEAPKKAAGGAQHESAPVTFVKRTKKPGIKPKRTKILACRSVPHQKSSSSSANAARSAPAPPTAKGRINQFGSNLLESGSLLDKFAAANLSPQQTSMPASGGAPSSPTPLSSHDVLLDVDGRVQIPSSCSPGEKSPAAATDLGWESMQDWEVDDETLAVRAMKLKEFRRSAATIPVSAAVPDLREEIAAASKITSAPRSLAVAVPIPNAKTTHVSKCFKTTSTSSSKTPGTPISETRRSVRGKGQDAEPILQKAVCRTAEKKGTHSPNSAFAMFLSFPMSTSLLLRLLAIWCWTPRFLPPLNLSVWSELKNLRRLPLLRQRRMRLPTQHSKPRLLNLLVQQALTSPPPHKGKSCRRR